MNRTPASEVGGESVTTLPLWPPRAVLKTLSYRSNTRVLGGINYNSSKAVLNTLEPTTVKSRETSKKGITVVKSTSNQGICGQKSSFKCHSESL